MAQEDRLKKHLLMVFADEEVKTLIGKLASAVYVSIHRDRSLSSITTEEYESWRATFEASFGEIIAKDYESGSATSKAVPPGKLDLGKMVHRRSALLFEEESINRALGMNSLAWLINEKGLGIQLVESVQKTIATSRLMQAGWKKVYKRRGAVPAQNIKGYYSVSLSFFAHKSPEPDREGWATINVMMSEGEVDTYEDT